MEALRKKQQNEKLTITGNLIILERGKDELLLVNSIDSKPLYIKTGRDYIKGFLDAVRELVTVENVKNLIRRLN